MEPHGLYDQNIDNLLMHIEQTQNAYYVAMDILKIYLTDFLLIYIYIYYLESYPFTTGTTSTEVVEVVSKSGHLI